MKKFTKLNINLTFYLVSQSNKDSSCKLSRSLTSFRFSKQNSWRIWSITNGKDSPKVNIWSLHSFISLTLSLWSSISIRFSWKRMHIGMMKVSDIHHPQTRNGFVSLVHAWSTLLYMMSLKHSNKAVTTSKMCGTTWIWLTCLSGTSTFSAN